MYQIRGDWTLWRLGGTGSAAIRVLVRLLAQFNYPSICLSSLHTCYQVYKSIIFFSSFCVSVSSIMASQASQQGRPVPPTLLCNLFSQTDRSFEVLGRKEIMLRFQYRYSIGLYSVIYLQPPHKERQRQRKISIQIFNRFILCHISPTTI